MKILSRATLALCSAGLALVAVAAPSAGALAADGSAALSHTAAPRQPLTWTVVPSPNRRVLQNSFESISCTSASACTAVGFTITRSGGSKTLIESWNGTAWSIVPSPDKDVSWNFLKGVSCTSASACVAVGDYYSSTQEPKTLVESWNGTAWSTVPSPNKQIPRSQNYLTGVSCVSASACTAVGWYNYTGEPKTLIESWNGTVWSIVPSPNPHSARHPNQPAYLSGISCAAAARCTAVGFDANRPVIESWNGTAWSLVRGPHEGGNSSYDLFGVSCASVASCTAVGYYQTTPKKQIGPERTMIESWNGAAWSITPGPNQGPANNTLGAVSCVSAADCTAVGAYQSSTNAPSRTLVESWNGTTWSIVPSPIAGGATSGSGLTGVSCLAAACTAVGGYGVPKFGSRLRTLVESGT